MTTPTDPHRPGSPTVREIAALTARLREISGRGRDVDAAERAAFLADKDALIARIPDSGATANGSRAGEVWDGDGWFARGYDDAHTAHLAALARTDDPVEEPELVDRPEVPITRAEAAQRLTDHGFDAASAQAMVTEYLIETSRAVGVPVYHWGLDQNDVDAIAADYQWVDHERGDTLAQARERAAEHATGWAARAGTVDRERSPGYAAHAEAQAAQWASRATAPEPFTHTDAHPDDVDTDADAEADGDPWAQKRAHEAEFDAVCERHPLPGDGPGYWVTDSNGTRWDDGVVDDDATGPEITDAPSDIWDADPSTEQTRAGAEWEAVRGDDSRSYSTMMGNAARALGSVPPVAQDDAARREQLARWYAEDQATENDTVDAEQGDGAPVDLGRG